ncbi:energy-coupling factor transport system permease protein [Evansella vedderi]|uniref:Energy-coupling factor transporter transmembrane protein EcfT n=1 Tax=Evansella vedderi TaxID=38282 RepID=A0ABT9ZXR5_9BACI|nr:energy-coupling factor transporter transmembrane component T [Evansella vedderi]MDQ0256036.1 energy-coupling factor transport system permease protein [Evansella vedderi]
MLDHVIIGQYVPGKSFVHRMDPRAKLICLMLFVVFLFISRHPFVLIGGLILTTTAFYYAKIPLRFYIKGMRFIVIIILFTFILHLFLTREGPAIFSTPIFTIYLGGVTQGGFMATRLLVLFIMASLLTLTTTPVALTDGLETLMKPLKKLGVPTHELAFMMSIALRFIPTLLDETAKIIKAQRARGANFTQGSLWNRLKAVIPIFIPLFVQSFKRAEDLATAMEARGYEGGEGRTKFRLLTWLKKDTYAVIVFALYALIVLIVKIGGGN